MPIKVKEMRQMMKVIIKFILQIATIQRKSIQGIHFIPQKIRNLLIKTWYRVNSKKKVRSRFPAIKDSSTNKKGKKLMFGHQYQVKLAKKLNK